MTTPVPDRLAKLGDLYRERNAVYGNDYKHLGASFRALFPDGITLSTEEEFIRFILFVHVHGKLIRYARTMKKGGHPDSLDDISVYAQMLAETDAEAKEWGTNTK